MKAETAQCACPENAVADFPQLGEVAPVVRLVFEMLFFQNTKASQDFCFIVLLSVEADYVTKLGVICRELKVL